MQKTRTSQNWIMRMLIYLLGLLSLGAGISMNTMTGMGVSPMLSWPYAISQIWGIKFATCTMMSYFLFVAGQFVLKGKKSNIFDVLQILLSVLFARYIDFFQRYLWIDCDTIVMQIIVLCGAITFTGVGVAMSTSMRLVPNPGDGIVQAIADKMHKPMGFAKNMFDFLSMAVALVIGLVFGHRIIGIGVGTVCTMLFTGRVVAVFQHFFYHKMLTAAGMDKESRK